MYFKMGNVSFQIKTCMANWWWINISIESLFGFVYASGNKMNSAHGMIGDCGVVAGGNGSGRCVGVGFDVGV